MNLSDLTVYLEIFTQVVSSNYNIIRVILPLPPVLLREINRGLIHQDTQILSSDLVLTGFIKPEG